ncbi:DnaB-like helicase C-terminal domain-containing protein [Streptomyces sp. NRRL S-920]|uniref:DnaB-like helicase C-terminal domain-containing protein n=1 Tax=Streptomyces sp. NRRL S-920 TaxID=1463921 RepID=UPI0004C6EE02|nr:DnaB-like helicase C-terminal domain-containing protein [Streptomyces sp. NRRL S-920]
MGSTEQSPVLTMAELLASSGYEPVRSSGSRLGIPTGLKGLDAAMGGLEPGTLTVLASRPGLGRSSLLQSICQWNASGTFLSGFPKVEEREVVPVLFASAEQSPEQIMVRALSAAARMARDRIRTGEFVDDEDIRRLKRAQSLLEAAPLYVLAPAVFTDGQLAEHARRLVGGHQVQLVGVDGLEAMGSGLSLGQAARALKTLARELAAPVIVTAPLWAMSRRPLWRPALEDLHDEFAFAADTVVLVHREDAYDRTARPMEADLMVAKARSARPAIAADIAFQPHYARFTDIVAAA